MSAVSTPTDSPVSNIQPLHNPSQAAHVVVPQAPIGTQVPGLGAKALLAKRMANAQSVISALSVSQRPDIASSSDATYVSPTDKLMTPVSQKLSAARKKHFTKGAKPAQLFAQQENDSGSDNEKSSDPEAETTTEPKDPGRLADDDENPF